MPRQVLGNLAVNVANCAFYTEAAEPFRAVAQFDRFVASAPFTNSTLASTVGRPRESQTARLRMFLMFVPVIKKKFRRRWRYATCLPVA